MGYRLHFAKHYAPKWEGGYFNWDLEKWQDLFYSKFYENGWKSEYEDIYEVDRKDVQDYIDEIKELFPEDKNEFFPDEKDEKDSGYTNKQIIEILEDILTSEDDLIRLECF